MDDNILYVNINHASSKFLRHNLANNSPGEQWDPVEKLNSN